MRFAWLAALCLFASTAGMARPYSVEDMLSVEDYGQVLFSPDGGTLVVERLGGQKTAARFTYDYFVRRARSRIYAARVAEAGGLEPLFVQDSHAGYWIAGFSPSGRRLAVYRLERDRITLGVVDMATHRVRWLAVTPDQPAGNANPVWIDDNRLLSIALPPGKLPLPLDFGGRAQKALPRLWERTARGQSPAMSVMGGGVDLQAGQMSVTRRLVLIDLAGGSVRSLATGDFIDLSLSPDRRHAALVERGAAVPAPPSDEPFSLDFQSRRLRLRIAGLDGSSSSPCAACDLAPDLLAWGPDGSRVLFFARADGAAWQDGHLYTYGVKSRQTVPLATGGVRPSLASTTPGRFTARAGWFGDRPVVFGTSGSERADWFLLGDPAPVRLTGEMPMAPAGPLLVGDGGMCVLTSAGLWSLGDDGIARLRMATAGATLMGAPLSAFDVGTRLLFAPVRDSSALWLRRVQGSTHELVEASCRDGLGQRVALLEPAATVPAVSTNAHSAATITQSRGGVTTLALLGRHARRLDRINGSLSEIDQPEAVALRRQGPGGPLIDWLLLPPYADPHVKLPLIVIPYPGAIQSETRPSGFGLAAFEPEFGAPLLAAHGYAVLEPSLPIGKAEPVDDIPAALRPALAAALATGRIDPARIGVLGHSYGGYAALMLATELPCLRSIVASASISDLLPFYGDLDPRVKLHFEEGLQTLYPFAWAETGQGRMGVPPWRDPGLYLRNSPFYRFDRVTAPILLLHGDLDPLSVEQAERTYAALYRLGKDVRLVRFYGEGHVPASPGTIRERWRETFAWLDRTMAVRPVGSPGADFDIHGGCAAPSRP